MVLPHDPIAFKSPAVDQHSRQAWHNLNEMMASDTAAGIYNSRHQRDRAMHLRNLVQDGLQQKLRESESALRERASDVERSAKSLRQVLRRSLDQLSQAEDAKIRVERAREDITQCRLSALTRCLAIRDRRTGEELVKDALHDGLVEEYRHLRDVSRDLHEAAQKLWTHICRLRELSSELNSRIEEKDKALADDFKQLSLDKKHKSITLKPEPVLMPRGTVSERHWWGTSAELMSATEAEIGAGEAMICQYLRQVREAQSQSQRNSEKTRALTRKTIRDQTRAIDTLKNQREKLEKELPELSQTLLELERCLVESSAPLKLAETRLENRKWRLLQEVCDDLPKRTISDEASTIHKFQEDLRQRVQQANDVYQVLSLQLHHVNRDIEMKSKTLELETKCYDIHSRPFLQQLNLLDKTSDYSLVRKERFANDEEASTSGVSDVDTSWEEKEVKEEVEEEI